MRGSGGDAGDESGVVGRPVDGVDVKGIGGEEAGLMRGEVVDPEAIVLIVVVDVDLVVLVFLAGDFGGGVGIGANEGYGFAIVRPVEGLDAAGKVGEGFGFAAGEGDEPELHGVGVRLGFVGELGGDVGACGGGGEVVGRGLCVGEGVGAVGEEG